MSLHRSQFIRPVRRRDILWRVDKEIAGRFDHLESSIAGLTTLIDNLATVCAKQFAMIEVRFDGIDDRLDKVEKRLDGVEGRLDRVEGSLDSISRRMDDEVEQRHKLGERVSKLEGIS